MSARLEKGWLMRLPLLVAASLLTPSPSFGQRADQIDNDQEQEPAPQPQPQPSAPAARIGQPAESSAGIAGKRRTTQDTLGIDPAARLSNRIQNRVQSRLRNRIDETYDPRANAASPFEDAEEQSRTAGKRTRP